ncbi:MAG: serine protease AprX, partial [Kribbellaceae bacterium]|nr:serine protease AprX [Kribbellaceae bacterium]
MRPRCLVWASILAQLATALLIASPESAGGSVPRDRRDTSRRGLATVEQSPFQNRNGKLRVVIALRVPGALAAVSRRNGDALSLIPDRSTRPWLNAARLRSGRRYFYQQDRRRRLAVRRLGGAAADRSEASLGAYRAVQRLGGKIEAVNIAANTVTALMPRATLRRLARRPDVESVNLRAAGQQLDIGSNSASVGASTWWSAGYSGGRGFADLPVNFAVDQDPVLQSHPAFAGITFETPRGTERSVDPSITRHGTALLSMAAAQGPVGCPLCQPVDAEEKGVAPGVGKVLDPSGAGAETDWAAGVPYYWYDDPSGTWKLQPGAPDPAQVINFSRGNDANYDDSIGAQEWDATVDTYGVTATVAAGNSGPAAHTVNDPALAYNVIGVGAFSGGGTTDPSDDSVFSWSSRGPTVGGRKKPDLVAVGDGGLAYSYFETTGKLWKYDTGTSYAAPQVGGGAILLAGAGIRDPKVVKAILINSARQGRATPASTMGTQTGWQPDWGWGE